ncbi:hypothetical protein Q8F55_004973 [Vanrija albida]|uniref:Uncharacterized protein n=1 Tax=Vanrija albida TaxID=181172 RepID=A0ABR3Q0B4_9TREE
MPHDVRTHYTGASHHAQHTGATGRTALPPYATPASPRPPSIATFASVPGSEPPSYAAAWASDSPRDAPGTPPANPFAAPHQMALYEAELAAYRTALGSYHYDKAGGYGADKPAAGLHSPDTKARHAEGTRFAPPPAPEPPLTPPPEGYTLVDACASLGHDTSPRLPGVLATAALFPLSMVWHAARKEAKCNRCGKAVPIEPWCGRGGNSCGRAKRQPCGQRRSCGGGWGGNNEWQRDGWGNASQPRRQGCGARASWPAQPVAWAEWKDPRSSWNDDWNEKDARSGGWNEKGARHSDWKDRRSDWDAKSRAYDGPGASLHEDAWGASQSSGSSASSCSTRKSRCGERREERGGRCGERRERCGRSRC